MVIHAVTALNRSDAVGPTVVDRGTVLGQAQQQQLSVLLHIAGPVVCGGHHMNERRSSDGSSDL